MNGHARHYVRLRRICLGFYYNFMRTSSFIRSIFTSAALCSLLLTACGTKPDGTPYGVDPARTDVGRQKKVAAIDSVRRSHYNIGMPKGAEVNAVTGAAKAGAPLTTQPL
jgi:hypothetical protein